MVLTGGHWARRLAQLVVTQTLGELGTLGQLANHNTASLSLQPITGLCILSTAFLSIERWTYPQFSIIHWKGLFEIDVSTLNSTLLVMIFGILSRATHLFKSHTILKSMNIRFEVVFFHCRLSSSGLVPFQISLRWSRNYIAPFSLRCYLYRPCLPLWREEGTNMFPSYAHTLRDTEKHVLLVLPFSSD